MNPSASIARRSRSRCQRSLDVPPPTSTTPSAEAGDASVGDRPRPNIFGVAKEAEVSITTVSHVFSGKRHVSEETRERVLRIAGYRDGAPRTTWETALEESLASE